MKILYITAGTIITGCGFALVLLYVSQALLG